MSHYSGLYMHSQFTSTLIDAFTYSNPKYKHWIHSIYLETHFKITKGLKTYGVQYLNTIFQKIVNTPILTGTLDDIYPKNTSTDLYISQPPAKKKRRITKEQKKRF